MSSGAETLRVVDRIYTAAMDPAEWMAALEAITDLLDAGHTILAARQGPTPTFALAAGVEETSLARLFWAGAANLLGPLNFDRLPPGSIVARNAIVADRDF